MLEGYDTADPMDDRRATRRCSSTSARELVAGVGGVYELTPRAIAALEAQAFIPLPDALSLRHVPPVQRRVAARRSTAATTSAARKAAISTALVTLGMMLRVSADVTANLMVGTGLVGARGDDFRVTTGLIWSPQPARRRRARPQRPRRRRHPRLASTRAPTRPRTRTASRTRTAAPIPTTTATASPTPTTSARTSPRTRTASRTTTAAPSATTTATAIPDAADKCPTEAEDKDGFEDDDGCPDDDNDGDGLADANDKCPNDAETVNGFEDDDGCPDVRGTTGPEERADRIDLKGEQVAFARGGATLTAPAKQLLAQVATIIKNRKLAIRIEVHVALGTKSTSAARSRRRSARTSSSRSSARGDPRLPGQPGRRRQQLQAVGIGSDRPLGTATPTDPVNERVDFIKAQQGGTP